MNRRRFFSGVWAELTGRAERERLLGEVTRQVADAVSEVVFREAVCRIRRAYLLTSPSDSPEYERGFGDAVAKMTQLLDPDNK